MPIDPNAIVPKNEQRTSKSSLCTFSLSDPLFTFDDIVLPEDTLREIKDTCSLIKHSKIIFEDWNLGTVLKKHSCLSFNLYGESGTGKTVTAHAISSYLEKKIVLVNYADIESKYVGETSKNLVNLFAFALENNAVIIFDEADALLSKRVTSMSSTSDVSVNQTRNVLLHLLDGYNGIVLFTTNFVSNYDSAFYRRILAHIKFDLPNKAMREKIWLHFLVDAFPIDEDKNVMAEKLSSIDGLSGSDISNCMLRTAIHIAESGSGHPVRCGYPAHNMADILQDSVRNKNACCHQQPPDDRVPGYQRTCGGFPHIRFRRRTCRSCRRSACTYPRRISVHGRFLHHRLFHQCLRRRTSVHDRHNSFFAAYRRIHFYPRRLLERG